MFDKIVNSILVLLVGVAIGLYVHSNYFAQPTSERNPQVTYRSDWRVIRDVWGVSEDTTKKVQLVIFSDYECPGCKSFETVTLPVLREKYDLSLTVIHYPIKAIHRFASQAAKMAECSVDEGVFFSMHRVLFAHADSFGLKPWDEYAKEAGIQDLAAWNSCLVDKTPRVRIEGADKLRQRLGINSTPTPMINGWQLTQSSLTAEGLSRVIDEIISGKKPKAE